jgi:hypothetical protein
MGLFGRKDDAPANKAERVVQFRQKDAQRIASVVHTIETARKDAKTSKLPRAIGGSGGGTFATARFTGAWSKDTLKTITFLADTTETVNASNIFSTISLPSSGVTALRCAVALEGTTWVLIAAECS